MSQFRDLKLIPDGPRLRQLVARRLGKTEDEVQTMKDRGDSLERVVLAVEEVLDVRRR